MFKNMAPGAGLADGEGLDVDHGGGVDLVGRVRHAAARQEGGCYQTQLVGQYYI